MENYIYEQNQTVKSKSTTGVSIAKVFLYVFLGLLITAITAFSVGAGLFYGLKGDEYELSKTYSLITIIAAIALLVDTFAMQFVVLRGKHSILVPAIIYALLIGVFVSSFVIYIDWRILGLAFALTAGIFAIMSLIAAVAKNLNPVIILAGGLLMGIGIISLINFFMMLAGVVNVTLYWIVSLGLFAVIMLVSIYDIWNVKRIAESGQMSNDVALFCAFTIYVDFIYIFIRLVIFLSYFARKN